MRAAGTKFFSKALFSSSISFLIYLHCSALDAGSLSSVYVNEYVHEIQPTRNHAFSDFRPAKHNLVRMVIRNQLLQSR